MPHGDDLKAAVEGGILSAEQAARLTAFLDARARGAEEAAVSSEDERFRLFKGFNDVFLATGVTLALVACLIEVARNLTGAKQIAPTPALAWEALASAALAWGFAEVLVARYRALLPGIVACIGFAVFISILSANFVPPLFGLARPVLRPDNYVPSGDYWMTWTSASWASTFLGTLLAALLFYARFRFPFALLIAGGSLVWGVFNGVLLWRGLKGLELAHLLVLACGLLLFTLAMRFDASDTARETRRSDCGFWLHLAAAPAIVYPVLMLTAGMPAGFTNNWQTANALIVILVVALLALVALVIDRRALLVSSLVSLGIAVGYLIKTTNAPVDSVVTITLALLGSFVVGMGLAWHPLRAAVLKPFTGSPLLNFVPPVKP